MSFLQWLVVDAIEAASDTVLALSAAGFVWTSRMGCDRCYSRNLFALIELD
ncbi:MAG: hypothetical protein WBF99_05025 [Xanthobacteraceae bacterium]